MVLIGKFIMGNSYEKFFSFKRTGDFYDDLVDSKGKSDSNKGKKGITSFFKSFLRRGKDLLESFIE